jgi:hypothetical protein
VVISRVVFALSLAACGHVESLPVDAADHDSSLVADGATPTLSVTLAGNGTVTSTPAGIDCGATCSTQVEFGTQVSLAATPGAGATFSGWSGGACSGTGACVVTVDADTTVIATFTCPSSSMMINYSGAIVTFSIPTCVSSLTIDAYGAQGGNATAVAGGLGAGSKARSR